MKRATQCGLLLAVLGCTAASVRADAVGDYKVILDRNPFGLKPPVIPPPETPIAPPETPTKYKLSGFTALFKPPRAMFVNEGVPGKPEYISLPEGERGGGITVLSNGINFAAGTVRVIIAGEERTLSFEKDGIKAPVGSPVMTAPDVPRPPLGLNPVPSTPGGSMMVPPPGLPGQQFNRPPTGMPPSGIPTANPASGIGPATIQFEDTPSRQMRTIPINTTQQPQSQPPPAPNVDPAEQALRMEIMRKVTEVQVQKGELPPLPGTDLTPLLQPPTPLR